MFYKVDNGKAVYSLRADTPREAVTSVTGCIINQSLLHIISKPESTVYIYRIVKKKTSRLVMVEEFVNEVECGAFSLVSYTD